MMNDRRMDDWADSQSDVLKELEVLMLKSQKKESMEDKEKAIDAFLTVQSEIKSSPLLYKTFKELKARFLADPMYRAGTNELFVEVVEMMDLDEEKND